MTDADAIAADLQFVKDAVTRRDRETRRTPIAIPILWGTIALAGCLINDFNPRYAWAYWGVVPVIGFFLSWLIGGRAAFSTGDYDSATGIRMGLHWGSIFFAALPIWLDFMKNYIDKREDKDDPPDFEAPGNIVFLAVNQATGAVLPAETTGAIREAFISGTQPAGSSFNR